jgi:hypothetical protein
MVGHGFGFRATVLVSTISVASVACGSGNKGLVPDGAVPGAPDANTPSGGDDASPGTIDAGPSPACAPGSGGNPFVDGWYADPDMKVYGNEYWVYPTYSAPYEQQTYLDAFSSTDLVHWTKHAKILDTSTVTWATRAIWAPSPIFRDGTYYLYFGANDIQSNAQLGGIGVATASQPSGPFVDALGHPLIGQFENGAQPIDQNVFIDDDGQAYLYYGGWGHCNVVKLNADMKSLGTFSDGTTFKEITPSGYVEGALMFKRDGSYYLMWSEGGWTGPDYRVSYAMASSPTGPFTRLGTILGQNASIGTGSGHNTVVHRPGTDEWYIFFHRHPLGETDGNHRVLAYERLVFAADGTIEPVVMTTRDEFCDGNAIGWTGTGSWSVVAGRYLAPAGAANALSLLNTSYAALDYAADVAPAAAGEAGLVFRVRQGAGYAVGLDAGADRVRLFRLGMAGELASASVAIDAGTSVRLRIVAVGSRIEVFLDDEAAPILAANDATFTTGATGLFANGAAAFDNVSVVPPPGAIVYADGSFGGAAVSLAPGSYTLAQLEAAGIANDSMSSLRVPAGWTVDVFADDQFLGTKWTFTADAPLVPAEANDAMSSARITAP